MAFEFLVQYSSVVGLVGGLIGIAVGIYTIAEKLWFNKPVLNVGLKRNYIINFGNRGNSEPEGSYFEAILCISNVGGGRLGIGRILVDSNDKNYPIAVINSDYNEARDTKELFSFALERNECQWIKLWQRGPPITHTKQMKPTINVFDLGENVIWSKDLDLYVGYHGGNWNTYQPKTGERSQ